MSLFSYAKYDTGRGQILNLLEFSQICSIAKQH